MKNKEINTYNLPLTFLLPPLLFGTNLIFSYY